MPAAGVDEKGNPFTEASAAHPVPMGKADAPATQAGANVLAKVLGGFGGWVARNKTELLVFALGYMLGEANAARRHRKMRKRNPKPKKRRVVEVIDDGDDYDEE